MNDASVIGMELTRIRSGSPPLVESDKIAREEPLELRVGGKSIAVIMRTPGHDAELAAGFLLAEGLLKNRGDWMGARHCAAATEPQNILDVFLAPATAVDFSQLTRHVFASSSCGLCGKTSIESVHQHFPPLESRCSVSAELLTELPSRMRRSQSGFDETGGLHAAALFDSAGKINILREDVGRHNAVDKILGWSFLEGRFPLDAEILLVSGRASFEILQKALAGRVPIICAVSAPSSLAVEFARESGQTLVGFLRNGGMNVYSGAHRVR